MRNLLYILFFIPLLFSCQEKYNAPPFDEKEKELRAVPIVLDDLILDSLWQKRDSLTYLRFKNVKSIYIKNTDSIPNWIENFENLNNLEIFPSHKKINFIPKRIGNLKNLTHITLSDNKIKTIPKSLYLLSELKYLELKNNYIEGVSNNLSNLKNLKSIDLSNNPLKNIPKEICNLNELKYLVLENTEITTLPKCLGTLPNIDWINISGTQLKEFPIEILNAPKLNTIHALNLKLNNYKEVKELCKKRNITFYYDE